jgi:5-methylcytosine-specific restriction endonuclease McrA
MRLSVPPKEADPHYRTAEHREWSKAVIQRAAGMCQDCGRTGARLFADHVTELRDGGAAFDPRNGVARCGSCHGRKTMRERARRMKSSA